MKVKLMYLNYVTVNTYTSDSVSFCTFIFPQVFSAQ
jgi:hypothetical protein